MERKLRLKSFHKNQRRGEMTNKSEVLRRYAELFFVRFYLRPCRPTVHRHLVPTEIKPESKHGMLKKGTQKLFSVICICIQFFIACVHTSKCQPKSKVDE